MSARCRGRAGRKFLSTSPGRTISARCTNSEKWDRATRTRVRTDEPWLAKKEARMAEKDIHYYEPANGHGLKHDPFNAIVAPRPIGWISSRDAKGNINLAPYSFFNAFCYKPPIVGFSSTSWKDSVANIQETKEFCWNLSIMDLAKQMNA